MASRRRSKRAPATPHPLSGAAQQDGASASDDAASDSEAEAAGGNNAERALAAFTLPPRSASLFPFMSAGDAAGSPGGQSRAELEISQAMRPSGVVFAAPSPVLDSRPRSGNGSPGDRTQCMGVREGETPCLARVQATQTQPAEGPIRGPRRIASKPARRVSPGPWLVSEQPRQHRSRSRSRCPSVSARSRRDSPQSDGEIGAAAASDLDVGDDALSCAMERDREQRGRRRDQGQHSAPRAQPATQGHWRRAEPAQGRPPLPVAPPALRVQQAAGGDAVTPLLEQLQQHLQVGGARHAHRVPEASSTQQLVDALRLLTDQLDARGADRHTAPRVQPAFCAGAAAAPGVGSLFADRHSAPRVQPAFSAGAAAAPGAGSLFTAAPRYATNLPHQLPAMPDMPSLGELGLHSAPRAQHASSHSSASGGDRHGAGAQLFGLKPPPRYNGESDYVPYRNLFLQYAHIMEWTLPMMGVQLSQRLTDKARDALRHVQPHLLFDFATVDSLLARRFAVQTDPNVCLAQLHKLRQRADQSLEQFADSVEDQARGAYPDFTEDQLQREMVRIFVAGLYSETAQWFLMRENLPTLAHALHSARVRPPAAAEMAAKPRVRAAAAAAPAAAGEGGAQKEDAADPRLDQLLCSVSSVAKTVGEVTKAQARLTSQFSALAAANKQGTAERAGRDERAAGRDSGRGRDKDHRRRDERRDRSRSRDRADRRSDEYEKRQKSGACFHCGRKGHRKAECYQLHGYPDRRENSKN